MLVLILQKKHDIYIFDSKTSEVISSHLRIDTLAEGFDILLTCNFRVVTNEFILSTFSLTLISIDDTIL